MSSDPQEPVDLLAPYRDGGRGGQHFICEGRWAVEALMGSDIKIRSAVFTEGAHEDLATALLSRCPVARLSKKEVSGLVGFPFHRGVLACALRPTPRRLQDWVLDSAGGSDPSPHRTVVVCPQIADAANIGAIVRNAAALGASAVIIGAGGADPWSRKGVRASAGGLFRIPVLRSPDLEADRQWLEAEDGWMLIGTAADGTPLRELDRRPARDLVIVFGAEESGLPPLWRDACDQVVSIPMHNGMDSLNVASTSALVLDHLMNSKGR